MVQITPALSIPEDELRFTATRSGGPGGQNVNKVNSRVTLFFDLEASRSLGPEQKVRIRTRLGTRVSKAGVLRVVSQWDRSQAANRVRAVERFAELLREALADRAPRKKTRAPRAVTKARLEEKRRRSRAKRDRSSRGWEG